MGEKVLDLGGFTYVSSVELKWEKEGTHRYRVELSLDGGHWVRHAHKEEEDVKGALVCEVVNAGARYVRITAVEDGRKDLDAGLPYIRAIPGPAPAFINGADVSHLQQMEDFGGRYYNRLGKEQDCLEILKDHGVNYIRLKVWNKPGLPLSDPGGYNDKAHVLEMAKRVKTLGFKLLLDFHYSDWWADPGKQFMPEEWKELSFEDLKKTLYDYTFDVVSALKEQGTQPEMVQVGNEITNGMLWDTAKVSDEFDTPRQWDKLCELLKNGLSAVKAVDPAIQTLIHTEKSGDNEKSRYFYDNLAKRQVDFDIIGLSYYPIWHGTLSDFERNAADLVLRYGKGLIVVETAYPYTTEDGDGHPNAAARPPAEILPGYPPSVENQASILQAVIHILKSLPGGKGLGCFYWEPDFIPVEGAGWKYGEGCEWEDQTLFDFSGHALWSLDVFKMHQGG